MSRFEGETEYHCNWKVFSLAVNSVLKEMPLIKSDGSVLTKDDYRWKHAVRRLKNLVYEPSGGDRSFHFFDDDTANQTVNAELERRRNSKLTP
jgi:hypothetical protein|tara:strand:- start:143 stop:421 length:279 start_codon:yes stop_codon:yes gene_type:complete